ncbi:armadillo-type protein [Kockiozyma suomiensis]|uniref:armadillo-type protein n=1 Tax=Kockiozyma suomiensis TaxID=1337062 RepID=UPI003343C266
MITSSISGSCADVADQPQTDAFMKAKKVCVPLSQLALTLTRDTTAANKFKIVDGLEDLLHTLNSIPTHVFSPQLCDYVFFPLSHLLRLRERLDDRSTELVLQCIELLIRNSWGKNLQVDMLKQLMVLLTLLLDPPPQQNRKQAGRFISDETKRSGCRALNELFIASSASRSLRAFYKDGNEIPALGHAVAVLLKVSFDATDVECSCAAIDALRTLLVNAIEDGDVLASFLPGCVSTLSNLLIPSARKTHYRVMVKATELLGFLLALCLADIDFQDNSSSGSKTITTTEPSSVPMAHDTDIDSNWSSSSPSSDSKQNAATDFRTPSWLKATKTQVKRGLEPVLGLRTHHRREVRLEIKVFCIRLLRSCFDSLDNCRAVLLVAMVLFCCDADEEISSDSWDFMQLFGRETPDSQDIVKMAVYDWITALQRTLALHDDDVKSKMLQQMKIGLELLLEWETEMTVIEESIISSFFSSVSLTSSSPSKISSSDILSSSSDLVFQKNAVSSGLTPRTDGRFDFTPLDIVQIVGPKTAKELEMVLEAIGASLMFRSIADECVQVAIDSRSDIKLQQVAYWMYIHIVQGSRKSTELFEDYEATVFISQASEQLNETSLSLIEKRMNDDELTEDESTLVRLSLEGITLSADIMKEEFRVILMEVLFPVLNMVTSRSLVVRQHAYIALHNIALSSGYTSVSELLVQNVDYVLDAISLRINSLDISPRTPKILTVLIKLAGPSAIQYLDDIVASIFQLLDSYHGYSRLVEGFFEVLKAVVEETSIAYLTSNLSLEDAPRLKREGIWNLQELLTELQRQPKFELHEPENNEDPDENLEDTKKNISEDKYMKEMDHRDEHPSEPPEIWESPLPKPWYFIVKRIAFLSRYYLSHASSTLRYQLLDLLHIGIPVLATSKKELLPIINDIWPALVPRLKDPELHVVTAALQVMGDFSKYSGDFMSSRFDAVWKSDLKALFPKVVPRSREGKYSRSAQIYRATTAYLTIVLRNTRLKELLFVDILETSAPVLGHVQELKEAMEEVSSDSVWLYLNVDSFV